MAKQPLVSICLPVYNGERHVRDAIDSILGQTLEDFELIISDNASEDGTAEICQAALARDRRVRYVRADVNRGLARNFNRAFDLATGRYLTWIGHDDVMAPDYIERCVEVLDREAGTVLCFTNADYIDAGGHRVQPMALTNSGASQAASQRFHQVLWDSMCDPICGLMKRDVLEQTRLHGAYADSDRVLLAEMGLRGRFHHLPDRLFSRRMHALQATSRYTDRWERTLVFDPSKAGKVICPWWRQTIDLVAAIGRARLPWAERLACYKHLYWWCAVHRTFLWQDLLRGCRLIVSQPLKAIG